MSTKSLVWIGMTIGALAGAYAPLAWGGNVLSISSVIFSTVGGAFGIWIGYKLGNA